MQTRTIIITLVLLLLLPTVATAQGHIRLQSVAEIEKKIVKNDGTVEIVREPATKVVPGTEVIFSQYFENISSDTAENAVITNPVPQHMIYKGSSADGEGTAITFSVDNGKSYDIPANLFVFDATGRKFPARTKDYTHIRWTFTKPLPSGAKGVVRFRAILQ